MYTPKKLVDVQEFHPFLLFLEYKNEINKILNDLPDNIQKKKDFKNFQVKAPKIVVVGEQVSGKSTLLNVLLQKCTFPRKKNLCTKCPVELIIQEQIENQTNVLSVEYKGNRKEMQNFEELYHFIEEDIFQKQIKENIDESPIKITVLKKSEDFFPLHFIDLPGLHYKKKLSSKIITSYLEKDDSTFLFCVPWAENSDNNAVFLFIDNYLQTSTLKDKILVNSCLIHTKSDIQNKVPLHIVQNDFFKEETHFYTAYPGQTKENITALMDFEEEYFETLSDLLKLDHLVDRCGTKNILKFIGRKYTQNLEKFTKDLYVFIKELRIELAKNLQKNFKFWDLPKDLGFQEFKKIIISELKKKLVLENLQFKDQDSVELLKTYKKMIQDISSHWDSTMQRFDFFWNEIKQMIEKIFSENEEKFTLKFQQTMEEQKNIQEFVTNQDLFLQTLNSFIRTQFFLFFNNLITMISTYSTNDIKENPTYLTMFTYYQGLKDFDLTKKKGGHQLFSEDMIKDYSNFTLPKEEESPKKVVQEQSQDGPKDSEELKEIDEFQFDDERLKKLEEEKLERLEKERLEGERLKKEAERIGAEEAERLEKERLEAERLKKLEEEIIEAERLGTERLEKERLEAERLKKEEEERLKKLEENRIETEHLEAKRLEKERVEAERLKKEEEERIEAQRLEAERLKKLEEERLEAERLEAERIKKIEEEKLEAERLNKLGEERLEAERIQAERFKKEDEERKQLEEEHLKKEEERLKKLEGERLEEERLEKERLEAERLKKEKHLEVEESKKLEEKFEEEHLKAEKLEKERLVEKEKSTLNEPKNEEDTLLEIILKCNNDEDPRFEKFQIVEKIKNDHYNVFKKMPKSSSSDDVAKCIIREILDEWKKDKSYNDEIQEFRKLMETKEKTNVKENEDTLKKEAKIDQTIPKEDEFN